MAIKIVNALIAIIGGIGGAVIIFWILNKLAESLKSRWEDRVKPWMFAGPAILAIAVYLIYPAVVTIQYSFGNADSTAYVGFQNVHRPLHRQGVPVGDLQQHPLDRHRPGPHGDAGPRRRSAG